MFWGLHPPHTFDTLWENGFLTGWRPGSVVKAPVDLRREEPERRRKKRRHYPVKFYGLPYGYENKARYRPCRSQNNRSVPCGLIWLIADLPPYFYSGGPTSPADVLLPDFVQKPPVQNLPAGFPLVRRTYRKAANIGKWRVPHENNSPAPHCRSFPGACASEC